MEVTDERLKELEYDFAYRNWQAGTSSNAAELIAEIRRLRAEPVRAERDRLREVLEKAPHAHDCNSHLPDLSDLSKADEREWEILSCLDDEGLTDFGRYRKKALAEVFAGTVKKPCDCWKRAALSAPVAARPISNIIDTDSGTVELVIHDPFGYPIQAEPAAQEEK
jgi:hypothetical protein